MINKNPMTVTGADKLKDELYQRKTYSDRKYRVKLPRQEPTAI